MMKSNVIMSLPLGDGRGNNVLMTERPEEAPILIGAVGGSGTRVLARIVQHAGRFMGCSLNESEDSVPFVNFYDAWTPLYLKRGGRFLATERHAVEEDFRRSVTQHLRGRPTADAPWGVKNPRSLLWLPFWLERYPQMKFLHVVRYGLDMAFSGKDREFNLYRDLVLAPEERRDGRQTQMMRYWCRLNLVAAQCGETQLQARYLRVRFEDLCTDPARVASKIFKFLQVSDESRLKAAVAEVATPQTIGRWRKHPVRAVCDAMESGREGLERFGYWQPELWERLHRMACTPRIVRWIFKHIGMRRLDAW